MKTVLLLTSLLLAACASERSQPVETYDFGVAPAAAAPTGQDVFLAEVRSADWLGTTEMLYRLEYRNPRLLTPYSASHWAGTPAAMLTLRLRQAVGNGTSARGRQAKCSLEIFLSEFSQVFTSEHESRAVMHMRATLIDTANPGRTQTREFRIERPAPSPNAAGEAAAFADVTTSASKELNDWIAETGTCKS